MVEEQRCEGEERYMRLEAILAQAILDRTILVQAILPQAILGRTILARTQVGSYIRWLVRDRNLNLNLKFEIWIEI